VFSSGSLFSAPAAGGGLFSNTNAGGLFNNSKPLFGGQNSLFTGPTLFNQASSKKEDDDEEGDDDGEGAEQEDNEPPAFSADGALIPGVTDKPVQLKITSRPPEKSPYSKVFHHMVEKFKIVPKSVATKGKEESKGDQSSEKKSLGKGYLALESAEVNGAKVYLIVFRSLIGKTLFQGTISGTLSKMRRIEEKAIKLQLKLALLVKDAGKFRTEFVVVSYSRSEDLKEFETKFNEAIEELKSKETKKSE
jgi:hypothetical protein